MDVAEFLKRTDHRNLKNQIKFMVKQRLRERGVELDNRRQRLKRLLDEESQQYELELSSLLKSREEEKEAQRLEWIGLMRLERERAEEELLQLKTKQRHLENAEEVHHIYSREMLMDSKQAQLYQIEEKKALLEKQAKVERFWLETTRRYNMETEKREIVEQKLRKVVANVKQRKNLEQSAETKTKARDEAEALREEFSKDNMRARDMDTKCKNDDDFYEWRKKVHHRDVLERQILQNALHVKEQREQEQMVANAETQQNQRAILVALDQEGVQKVKNRAQQKEYLKYAEQEKNSLRDREKCLEDMLVGTGFVLEQKNKRPYGRNTR